ncbi:MAG: hypothetical protein ACE37F_07860 [Nannocystaceae bacterium]|nr:hypothetical protein [bacterium]
MFKLCIGLLFSGLLMAPTAPQHSLPSPATGHFPKHAKPTKKPTKKPAQQPDDFAASEYQGVISSMRVDAGGNIEHIYFKLAGNVRTIRIKGCGTKSTSQPLLNWAFTERRLVSIVTSANQCFAAMSVKR